MKPNHLYSLTPIKTDKYALSKFMDVVKHMNNSVVYCVTFPEIMTLVALENIGDHSVYQIKDENVIVRKTLMDEGEEKYPASIHTWWFHETPFMISHSFGRYGDSLDYWITDEASFRNAVKFVTDKLNEQSDENDNLPPVYDPDAEISHIGIVAGYKLTDYHEQNPNLQYSEGDEVYVWAEVNHLSYRKNYAVFQVRINKVFPNYKRDTYHGVKLDQRWNDEPFGSAASKMIYSEGNGHIGAQFSEAYIIGKVSETLIEGAIPHLYKNVVDQETKTIPDDYKFSHSDLIEWAKTYMPK